MAARIDLNCDLGEDVDPWEPGRRRPGRPAARRRDQRERRLRLPRRGRAGDGGGLPGGGGPRGVDRCARLLPGPRALRPPGPRRPARRAARAGGLPARRAARRSRAAVGATVAYVKPHGALYNAVVHDEAHARAVVEARGPARGRAARVGACSRSRRRRGCGRSPEAFADRGYRRRRDARAARRRRARWSPTRRRSRRGSSGSPTRAW